MLFRIRLSRRRLCRRKMVSAGADALPQLSISAAVSSSPSIVTGAPIERAAVTQAAVSGSTTKIRAGAASAAWSPSAIAAAKPPTPACTNKCVGAA